MSVPYSSCITLTYKNVKQSTTTVYASKNKNVITLLYIFFFLNVQLKIFNFDIDLNTSFNSYYRET